MTNFKDYLQDIYSSKNAEIDFSSWNENLSRKDFSSYFNDYIKTLSKVELSRVAETVIDNQ